MDKRFFIALLLTALVVAITPVLFPGPAPTPVPASARRTPAPGAVASAPGAAPATAVATNAPAAAVSTPGPPAAGPLVVPGAAAETTTVGTSHARYSFSSLGAVPVAARMLDYRSLSRGERRAQPVELTRAGEPLLRYRIVVGADTVALDRVQFMLAAVDSLSTPKVLRYEAGVGTGRVALTYTVVPDSYTVRVRGEVSGLGDRTFALIDLPPGLRSEEADTLEDQRHLAYAYKPQSADAKSISFAKLEPGEQRLESRPLTWVVAKSKYFLVGLLTDSGDTPFAELTVVGGARTSKVASHARATVVESLANGTFSFTMYAGPQEWRRLHALGRDFENANPYGGFLQGVVQPFATIVMRVLLWMHERLSLSYGWVLVIFGVAVRILLWPLNQKAMRSSLQMQRLQPQLQEIQKRHQNDPQKLQSEMMRVYKEHNMSPFSTFAGCLPMLIPMPVLFALFFVFQNTIEFRGVPFLWLPDISVHDPYYILPVVVGISAFVLSWIGMRNTPPNPQTKMMGYIFPPMMTFLFLKFASGLNLYYAVQNLATLPQQWLLSRERAKATKS